jgi:hypothetical protein
MVPEVIESWGLNDDLESAMEKESSTNDKMDEPRATTLRPPQPKRASVSLTSGKGDMVTKLTILARRTRGNGGETSVTIKDGKKKPVRGMTTRYDTFQLAVAALDKLVQDALHKGWHKTERAGGFKPRPDAFAAIPVAPKGTR